MSSSTCNLFGQMAEDGEYPADMAQPGQMVENISCRNAVRYFRFGEVIGVRYSGRGRNHKRRRSP